MSARLANLLVTALVLWLLLALGRGSLGDLYASRYVYVGAIVAALILIEVASGTRVRSRAAAALVALAAAVSVALNVGWMVVWGNHLREESSVGRSQLAALDIAASRAPPLLAPSSYALQGVTARDYFQAVRKFGGSPAYTTAQLRHAPERAREAADEVLVPALGLRLTSSHTAAREPSQGASTASSLLALRALFVRLGRLPAQRIVAAGDCVTLTPRGGPAAADVAPGFASLVAFAQRPGSPLAIQVRRFGDHYTAVIGAQRGGTATLPAPPLGGAPDAWHVRVVSTGPTRICARR